MATLNLYKDREPHKIILKVDGEKKEFKLPTEYTAEEAERILETEAKIRKESKREVDDDLSNEEKLKETQKFWEAIFSQVLILFDRYHPEITKEKLKKILTQEQALEIIKFHRDEKLKETIDNNTEETEEGKKKQQKKD